MSEKTIIHKNKGETFKCHFDVDGVSPENVQVRLCLELNGNKNMFFNGQVQSDGECIIDIPRLAELPNQSGTMVIEAIADSMYFRLFECEVELKNSVEVKMKNEGTFLTKVESPKIVLTQGSTNNVIQEELKSPIQPSTTTNSKRLKSYKDFFKK